MGKNTPIIDELNREIIHLKGQLATSQEVSASLRERLNDALHRITILEEQIISKVRNDEATQRMMYESVNVIRDAANKLRSLGNHI